jgi:nicotinate-nucleotide adenylyltransferase
MEKDINELYMQQNIKIGLLGGTFDPPHAGHMHMAECASWLLGLDKIVFLICGNTPHKDADAVSPPEHRLAMLRLAIDGHENYRIDESELYSMEKSYTVNSIMRIRQILHPSSRLYFIIGADSLMYLEKWHDAERLMQITSFICIPREGFSDDACREKILLLRQEYSADIHYMDCPRQNAASAGIRRMLAEGMSIAGMVEPEVEKYIRDYGLYQR